MFRGLLAAAVALVGGTAQAFAAEPSTQTEDVSHAIFAFGGRVAENDILAMINPFTAGYEDHFVLGAGYQRFLWQAPAPGISFGVEGGVALRFARDVSGEIWGGPVIRYDAIPVFDTIAFSPAVTGGLSAVSDAMSGREEHNEAARGGDATLLFYFGPELNVSLVSDPAVEMFWRLHHRSGAGGTLGDMRGAANVQSVGFRRRF